jgi:hypothetical protein
VLCIRQIGSDLMTALRTKQSNAHLPVPSCRASPAGPVRISPATAAPCDGCCAHESNAQKGGGCRFRQFYGEFGNYDLAVAGLEIGYQDLICTAVKGTATTTGLKTHDAAAGSGAAAVTTTASGSAGGAPTSAKAPARDTSGKVRKCASSSSAEENPVAAGGKKPASAASGASNPYRPAGTAITIDTTAEAAIGPDEATLSRQRATLKSAATAASAGDDQGHVAGANHKAPATAGARSDAGAADGNLQYLSGRQAEGAADLSTSSACADETGKRSAACPLCAKGDELIEAGGRHREGDKASSVVEYDWIGLGTRVQ